MQDDTSRKVEQFKLLTETGAATLMGKLLRKFWHPIALGEEVTAGRARAVRVLGEDLTLYRGESGRAHLVGGRCAHRCTVLNTGVVQGEQIRCMYHGWRYDETGLCTEIPAEKQPRSRPIRIAGYPVHEYCGLIFAYLGEEPVPAFDLPRKHVLEDERRTIIAHKAIWDCNWFQHVENSLDAVHVSFAHLWGQVGQFGSSVTASIPELAYSETSAGIRQVATRPNNNVRVSDWTFPNNNHVVAPSPEKGDPWAHVSAWPVPVDDTRTMRFVLNAVETTDPAKIERLKLQYDLHYNPADHYDELFHDGVVSGVREFGLLNAQDYVAVRGQGVICDRTQENLSTSDAGIAFLRRIFLRELEAIRQGRPTKQWARLEEAQHLPPPPVQAAE
jgi:5,5'-dehydrodivanillate O-demethylase oxygenase subunit